MANERFLSSLVNYIRHNNNVLYKYAGLASQIGGKLNQVRDDQKEYREKLAEVIDDMVQNGSVPAEYKEAVYKDLKDSPVKMAEFIIKSAKRKITVGGASDGIKTISKKDAIVDCLFGS